MKYNFPKKVVLNKLYRLVRQMNKENFMEFIESINQKTFFISNKNISAVVVCDTDMEKIEIFHSKEALLTCHSLFSGDERSLDYYGYNFLSVEHISTDSSIYQAQKLFYEQNKFFGSIDEKVLYLAHRSGQAPCSIDNEEAHLILCIFEYLLEIKRLFDDGVEEVLDHKEDCVLCFEFDDEKLLYNNTYIALDSFDFLPSFDFKTTKNPAYINKLKTLPLNQGTLYLGNFYLLSLASGKYLEDKNKLDLTNILCYAASDTGVFKYSLYQSVYSQGKMNLRREIYQILAEIGLFDLIITDNYWLYLAIVDELKAINIEVKYEPFNRYNAFTYAAIKGFNDLNSDLSFVIECLDNIEANYHLLMYDIEGPGRIFAEEAIDESNDEDFDLVSDTDLIA